MIAPTPELSTRKTYGNINCTAAQRCGNCTRDVQAAIKFRIDAARAATKLLPDGQQVCCECGVVKLVSEFNPTKLKHPGSRCRACEAIQRRTWNTKRNARDTRPNHGTKAKYPCRIGCGTLVGHKGGRCLACYKTAVRTAVRKPATDKTRHPCMGNCGMLLEKEGGWCLTCKRQRQDMIAASSEHKIKKMRVLKSLASGSTMAVMHIGEDAFSLSVRCQYPSLDETYTKEPICGKPILVAPSCYYHATGRKITLRFLPRIEMGNAS